MSLTLYDFKPRFQSLLRPTAATLARHGVSANLVTLSTMLVSIAVGAFATWPRTSPWPFLLIPGWLFLRMAFNAIDGILARDFGQQSPLGAYLNELCDVISDIALYIPFAFVPPFGPWTVGLVIFASCVSEMAGALAPMVGARRRYDGPMGKSDRAAVFAALALCVGLGGALPPSALWIMPLLAALVAWNIVNRVRRGVAAARNASH